MTDDPKLEILKAIFIELRFREQLEFETWVRNKINEYTSQGPKK